MTQARDEWLSPTSHYYLIMGRLPEIARSLGSSTGGAEHLFLGMLHDGGWPVSLIEGLLDLDRAEAAVLAIISSPDYAPPSAPRTLVPSGHVQVWGSEVAWEMGDCYLGLEHAFLAMIRQRQTVPARALARLADLNAVAAAVVAAKNAPPGGPPDSAVFLPEGQPLDAPLRRALADALPAGTTYDINDDPGGRTWVNVISSDDTSDPRLSRQVLNTALASLGRPRLGS